MAQLHLISRSNTTPASGTTSNHQHIPTPFPKAETILASSPVAFMQNS
jgi:hypothetical protein